MTNNSSFIAKKTSNIILASADTSALQKNAHDYQKIIVIKITIRQVPQSIPKVIYFHGFNPMHQNHIQCLYVRNSFNSRAEILHWHLRLPSQMQSRQYLSASYLFTISNTYISMIDCDSLSFSPMKKH